MIKAVLFDLDGTLIDTNELIISSFNHTFKTLKNEDKTREEVISWFGEPLHITMGKFFSDTDKAISTYRDYNLKNHNERISLYDNTKEMLDELKKLSLKIGIVTSKNKTTAIRGIEFLGIKDYFDVMITSDDVKNHKPHKEPVLKALEVLNINPSNSLMVGDSIYDIMSGKDAGSKTCGVMFSLMKEKLLDIKADYYVENLIEILDIVK